MKVGIRAASWATWGKAITTGMLAPGVVLLFLRRAGSHAFIYGSEDFKAFPVLGSNRGDKVSIVRIKKRRCIAAHWPADQPLLRHPELIGSSRPTSALEKKRPEHPR